jgi:uncharacterized protein
MLNRLLKKAAGMANDRRGRLSHNTESKVCRQSGIGLLACRGLFQQPATRWFVAIACLPLLAESPYQREIAQWRHDREARLRAEGGWLTVTGLFWLREGPNSFGAGASNQIVLPDGPARAGVFDLRGGKVTVKMNGASQSEAWRELRPDSDDMAHCGRLSLYVIKRGDRYGIRMKDPESDLLKAFHGLEYFPAREEYRITAKFVPEPRKIPITNILGQTEPEDSPGYVVFQVGGREVRLYPVLDEPDSKELSFIFRDLTSGKETYGAGRFLDTELPHDGKVVLDFNKAYNPPCAFTPYATCPLPPKENRLPVRIEAGEKNYGH